MVENTDEMRMLVLSSLNQNGFACGVVCSVRASKPFHLPKVFHNKNKLLFKWSPSEVKPALKSGNESARRKEKKPNQIKGMNKKQESSSVFF